MSFSIVNKYQIYCITEQSLQYLWSSTPIFTCPNNTGHTVNPNSVTVTETAIGKYISGITASAVPEIMMCDTSFNDVNIRLPDATLNYIGSIGTIRTVKTSSANKLNIIPFSSQLINGNPILTGATLNNMFTLVSDGSNWSTIGTTMESAYINDLNVYLNNSVSTSLAYLLNNNISGPIRHTISTPSAVATLGSYTTAGSYIYPGSNFINTPSAIKSIVRGGTGDIRIYSIIGATTVAGATITALPSNTVLPLYFTNNINSISNTEDTWEIQIRRNTAVGGGNVFTQSTTFYY